MRIEVKNFGPIKDCEFEIDKFMVLIGPQATGKSTLSKLIYYFLSLKNITSKFIRDSINGFFLNDRDFPESMEIDKPESLLHKQLRKRFADLFGNEQQHDQKMSIVFHYSDNIYIRISPHPEDNRFITISFSILLETALNDFYIKIKNRIISLEKQNGRLDPDLVWINMILFLENGNTEEQKFIKNMVFETGKESIFIPAEKGFLSVFLGSMNLNRLKELEDSVLKEEFVKIITRFRRKFSSSLDEIISEVKVYDEFFNENLAYKASEIIKRILKGEYKYRDGEGRLFINPNLSVTTKFMSSGQQEVLWLLYLLFFIITDIETMDEEKPVFFIEEPEAHLFPETQKDLMEFISFVHKNYNCDFFITTHSPYILTAANTLIYADYVGNISESNKKKVSEIVPEDTWLPHENAGGYFLRDGKIEPLFSKNLVMFKAEMIDGATEMVEEAYSRLFEIENEDK